MKINVTFNKISYNIDGTSNGTKNGIYVALVDILKKFSHKLDATKPFLDALLINLDDNSIVKIDSQHNFLCQANGRYKLDLGAARCASINIQSIPRSGVIPDSDRPKFASLVDIEIAAMLSMLVYDKDPLRMINQEFPHQNTYGSSRAIEELGARVCGLKYALRAKYPYLIAVSERSFVDDSVKEHLRLERTLWVAFLGSSNFEDYICTDLRCSQSVTSTGKIHTGFLQRAQQYPKDLFTSEFKTGKYQRLIFTGHSLGGVIAHICAIEGLRQRLPSSSIHIYSIAFGAPSIGDYKNADWVSKYFDNNFLTVVNGLDFVPGFLHFSKTIAKLGKTLQNIPNAIAQLIRSVFIDDDGLGQESNSISSAAVIEEIKKNLGPGKPSQRASKAYYVPFGVYAFLRLDKIRYIQNQAGHDFITEHIEKLMLEEPHAGEWKLSDHRIKNYIESLTGSKVIVRAPSLSTTKLQIREAIDVCTPRIIKTSIDISSTGRYLDVKLSGLALSCVHPISNVSTCTTLQIIANSATCEIHGVKRNKSVTFRITNLLPPHARITVGPHRVSFMTDFGEIFKPLRAGDLMEQDRISHFDFTRDSPLNANLLYTAVLRAYFGHLHQSSDNSTRSTRATYLQLVQQLIQHLQPKSIALFEDIVKNCTNKNEQMADVYTCEYFHQKILPLIRCLYIKLQEKHEYNIPPGYWWAGLLLVVGVATVAISLTPAGIIVGSAFAMTGAITGIHTYANYYDADAYAYSDNLRLIAASIGVNVTNCKNEYHLEFEMKNKLKKSGVPVELGKANHISSSQLMKLFAIPATKAQPTLKGADESSKRKAFMLARCAMTIHRLRCSVTDQIYIAIIDLQRSDELLNTLWNISIRNEPSTKIQQYTFRDSTSNDDHLLSILLLPNLANFRETAIQLNYCYTITPVFYIVMAGHNDIDQIQTLGKTFHYPSTFDRDLVDSLAVIRRSSLQSFSVLGTKRNSPSLNILTIMTATLDAQMTDSACKKLTSLNIPHCLTQAMNEQSIGEITQFINKHLQERTRSKSFNIANFKFKVQF